VYSTLPTAPCAMCQILRKMIDQAVIFSEREEKYIQRLKTAGVAKEEAPVEVKRE
jgi:hypothetical protein